MFDKKSGKKNKTKYFKLATIVWLLIPVCLSPVAFAHAYLDAGTGSYAIQVAIGIIFGATFAFRNFFANIFAHFKRQPKNKKQITKENSDT